ncbi:MAG: FxsA family protein [Albidovulum sp.]
MAVFWESIAMWLLIIFIVVPLIEIGLFIQVGGLIGLWPTLAIILIMAFVGTWLLRSQGALAFLEFRQSMSEMRDPTEAMAHGALILFAAVLMITPGFFTDAIGLALLIRPIRAMAISAVAKRFHIVSAAGMAGGPAGQPRNTPMDGDVIEAEYTEVDGKDAPDGQSGWTRH